MWWTYDQLTKLIELYKKYNISAYNMNLTQYNRNLRGIAMQKICKELKPYIPEIRVDLIYNQINYYRNGFRKKGNILDKLNNDRKHGVISKKKYAENLELLKSFYNILKEEGHVYSREIEDMIKEDEQKSKAKNDSVNKQKKYPEFIPLESETTNNNKNVLGSGKRKQCDEDENLRKKPRLEVPKVATQEKPKIISDFQQKLDHAIIENTKSHEKTSDVLETEKKSSSDGCEKIAEDKNSHVENDIKEKNMVIEKEEDVGGEDFEELDLDRTLIRNEEYTSCGKEDNFEQVDMNQIPKEKEFIEKEKDFIEKEKEFIEKEKNLDILDRDQDSKKNEDSKEGILKILDEDHDFEKNKQYLGPRKVDNLKKDICLQDLRMNKTYICNGKEDISETSDIEHDFEKNKQHLGHRRGNLKKEIGSQDLRMNKTYICNGKEDISETSDTDHDSEKNKQCLDHRRENFKKEIGLEDLRTNKKYICNGNEDVVEISDTDDFDNNEENLCHSGEEKKNSVLTIGNLRVGDNYSDSSSLINDEPDDIWLTLMTKRYKQIKNPKNKLKLQRNVDKIIYKALYEET